MSNALSKQSPRVLFFGMQSNFSTLVLTSLMENNIQICAVVIPSQRSGGRPPLMQRRVPSRPLRTPLPLMHASPGASIIQTAWKQDITVWEVSGLVDPEVITMISAYKPDLICIACFSFRISRVIRDIPHLGCLNVHPSLLPAHRGPVPLFWIFRQGCDNAGVTVHLVDEGMDTGDILGQEVVEVTEGISYSQLETKCALRGGQLLVRTVWDLSTGRAIRIPQDEVQSSYQSFPENEDFVIHLDEWSARHVHNFICGVSNWRPIELRLGDERIFVLQSAGYSYDQGQQDPEKKFYWEDEKLVVRCKDGWARVVPDL